MSQNNVMLPSFPKPEGFLNKFEHYYTTAVGWMPTPLFNFFMTFLLLIVMFSQIRLATAQELNELEDLRLELKNTRWRSKLNDLELQNEKLSRDDDHNQMLATKFEDDYIAASKSRDYLEGVLSETLNNLAMANANIQNQESTVAKQAEAMNDMAQTTKRLQLEVKKASSLSMSLQQQFFFMFYILAEQSKALASLQFDVKLLENKGQIANACLTNSEKALVCWKNGPLQNILLCAFYLGSTLVSQGKRLQYKEVSALCSEITKSAGYAAHKEPIDLLWEMYRLWQKNKGLVHLATL